MDKTVDKMAAAFGGKVSPEKGSQDDDLAKQLARAKEYEATQNGRLKAQNEELERLRRENEELRRRRNEEDIASAITEEERAGIPEEVMNASTKMMRSLEERLQRRIDAVNADREHERAEALERAKSDIVSKVMDYCPTFLDDVSAGGDKNASWEEYKKYNGDSVNSAFARGDFNALKYHIDMFYQNFLHVRVPSGKGDTAEPTPRANGGGSDPQTGSGKVYTLDEFAKLYDELEVCRAKGDEAGRRRLEEEIKKAPSEGRVKDA